MPLQVTGIDTFLAAQSKRFFAIGGHGAAGFSWVPATVDGQPAFDVVPGPLGLGMINASQAYWAACAGAGLDQVIDDVWLVPDQPAGLQRALSAALCETKNSGRSPKWVIRRGASTDRKSTRLNSSHSIASRMPSSA